MTLAEKKAAWDMLGRERVNRNVRCVFRDVGWELISACGGGKKANRKKGDPQKVEDKIFSSWRSKKGECGRKSTYKTRGVKEHQGNMCIFSSRAVTLKKGGQTSQIF